MLLDDIALLNLALALGAQESRVGQEDAANGCTDLTRNHSRSHASHRVAEQNRSGKSERFDESNDVACVVAIQIPMKRRARLSVTSGVRHYYVVVAFESARQRNPAIAASSQSME